MNKIAMLKKIREIYDRGDNIIQYLKQNDWNSPNTIEDIMISYDFQEGEYTSYYYNNQQEYRDKAGKIKSYITEMGCDVQSIFEAGVGEATILVSLLNLIDKRFDWIGGVDLSWSRVKTAQKFANKELLNDYKIHLYVGDMFCLPLKDSSIDIVYTVHALEPNGGKEKEILKELYRVTRKYMILIEPSYELANEKGKKRMIKNGYIRGLKDCALSLGYKIVKYEPFEIDCEPMNPAAVMIIEKVVREKNIVNPLACPVTKSDLRRVANVFYSDESMLSYPIIDGVGCLTKENAVITTKIMNYNSVINNL